MSGVSATGSERRLAAILSADVVGYSRLMHRDAAATAARLNAYRERIATHVDSCGGRMVDAVGDNALMEFRSVLEAVTCADAIQEDLERENAALMEAERMRLRIGCHLGEVLALQGALYGDGVNVAARVEQFAPPGGVAISGIALEMLDAKHAMEFEDRGLHTLKNVDRPVRIHLRGPARQADPAPRSDASGLLDRVADAVADGRPVDWPAARREAPKLAERLERLEALQRIGAAFQRPWRPDGTEPLPRSLPAGEEHALFAWRHLQVLERLDEGAFGEIYRAFDPFLQREVALKLERERTTGDAAPRPGPRSASRGALEEARRLARVRHPNVLAVHGADILDGRVGIWTDLLRGRTLAQRLQAEGRLPVERALLIGVDLCRALAAVHGADLVHGDVKAANVMEEDGGNVVLLDFGSGRDLRALGGEEEKTGTPLMLSPEVLKGEPLDGANDLYALGALLHLLISSRYPIEARSVAELIEAHEAGARRPVREARSDLSAAVAALIERALAPRECRFGSAQEMERALADALLTFRRDGSRPGSARRAAKPRCPTNLPKPLTRFVGRADEMRKLARLVRRKRVVTVAGTGGAGKTRLSIQLARRLRSRFVDGVWFVDLSSILDREAVADAVAAAIGFRGASNLPTEESLIVHLAERETLLVLDNCEQVSDGVATLVARLLDGCERLCVLATSREELGLTGETIFELSPLALPATDLAGDELAGVESVQLFVDRASEVSSDFALSGANAADVARICRRVDGIALAIELAAARVRMLSVEAIADRLDAHFSLLEASGAGRPERHRTLSALIGWSYRLLTEAERALFRRLGVFAGGWTLEAAERVCGDAQLSATDVVGLLANLVGRSLVVRDGSARYRMLETVRRFARERANEEDAPPGVEAEGQLDLHARHLRHFANLGASANAELGFFLPEAEEKVWLARLGPERDNLRAALEWSVASESGAETGLLLASGLHWYWAARGEYTEGRRWLARLLERAPDAPRETRALALASAAHLAAWQGDAEAAGPALEEALALYRGCGDRRGTAFCMRTLGVVEVVRGDREGGLARIAAAVELARETGDAQLLTFALDASATLLDYGGEIDVAADRYREIISILERVGGSRAGMAHSHWHLGRIARLRGEFDVAESRCRDALVLFAEVGDRRGTAYALAALAGAAAAAGKMERAARISGAVSALTRELDIAIEAPIARELERDTTAAREALAGPAFESAWKKGNETRLDDTLSLVLAELG